MTSKEKAKELYLKFHFAIPAIADEWQQGQNSAKECALIAVNEIIEQLLDDWGDNQWRANDYIGYWQQVKKEIESL